ncbi:MAG: glycosyltransferase [Pararhodobacter sp.]|nr:glycosyltransferase [Pararhodobacter sp.]
MRVLFYNWVDHMDPDRRGGGVSVYQRNLIHALADVPGIETASLSSGLAQTLRPGPPRWALVGRDALVPGHLRHEIINSGLLSPAHADFGSPAQINHARTEATFLDFLRQTGPYDVIHFNNMEGVPATVLARIKQQTSARLVLSLHNYYPFCPQVNLWHQESANCTDFDEGRRCVTCLPVAPNRRVARLALALSSQRGLLGGVPGGRQLGRALWPAMRLAWHGYRRLRGGGTPASPQPEAGGPATPAAGVSPAQGTAYAKRRQQMVALINQHCDAVLCVSDRVRQIAAHHGITPALLHTAYIGTREARHWHSSTPAQQFLAEDGTLHLAYLGYMRADKGFPFLLDALSALPAPVLARLRLTIAARTGAAGLMARLQALAPRLASFQHLDGYTHDTLDKVLDGVALGVVPVMWEDNLPQVAIEMHARHIPLMTSDLGGAQELGRCPALVFRAGDRGDFARVVESILRGAVVPGDYWQQAMAPVTMQAHLAQLLPIYRGEGAA